MTTTKTVGLLARLTPKPGKAAELRALLASAVELARAENFTITWYAFETTDAQCWVFDTFADDAGRTAHLQGPIAQALLKAAPELLAEPPDIRPVGLLASKQP